MTVSPAKSGPPLRRRGGRGDRSRRGRDGSDLLLAARRALDDGRLDDALRAADDSVRSTRGLGDDVGRAHCELVHAEVAYRRGDALAASRSASRARAAAARSGDAATLRLALADAGLYLWSVGDGARARESASRALSLKPPEEPTAQTLRVLLHAARVDAAGGRFDVALDLLDAAEAVAQRAGRNAEFGPAALRAFIYVDIGALDVARALLARRPLHEAASSESPPWMRLEHLRLRATIALAAGERPEIVERLVAEGLASPAIELSTRGELERLRALSFLARGRSEEAERMSVQLATSAARTGRHAFGAQALALAARAGHPSAWLLRWLGALGLSSGGVAARIEYEGLAALASEPDPIGTFATTLKDLARARLVEHTPGPLRVTMKRTLRQIDARLSAQRRASSVAVETNLEPDVRAAKDEVGLVGSSGELLRAIATLSRASRSEASLVITGETGSGKELFARLAHRLSDRAAGPFVALNCAAIPHALLEAELFGHERGAFTGADRARPGLFVDAEGGTLLLDELGEMSAAMQSKLLRVLEDRIVRPVGGSRVRKVDVRVIAATHRDLGAMVASGAFREDLYYRLAAITVRVPSLRERPEDVPTLARALLARDPSTRGHRLDVPALTALAEHEWPGNVRELANALRVAAALSEGSVIGRKELADAIGGGALTARVESPRAVDETTLSDLRARHKAELRELVGRAIASADGNKRRAARALGVSRQGLYRVLSR